MHAASYDLTSDQLIALSDAELARRFGDLAGAVFDVGDTLGDQLFAFVAETFERFAPEAAHAAIVHAWEGDGPDELLHAIRDMRRRAAARALRDAFAAQSPPNSRSAQSGQ